ncbi:hypothetical protein C353_06635 [Cryptococcus neoformans AD1-83a]|nr:hypothetical protein C353_06635 [Cryptococcus neoformans var. grubii AD1-83a]
MNIRNNRTEARSTSYTDADVFDTKGRGTSSPERGGEVAGDGYGYGNGRKTVYLTDLRNVSSPVQGENGALTGGAGDVREVRLEPGRQGGAIKGKRNGTPEEGWVTRVGQGRFPRLDILLRWDPPVSLAVGSQYNNLKGRHHHQPPKLGPDLDYLHIHGWGPQIRGGSSSASSAYSWNNAAQPPSARPHTPPTGACYLPAGKYPSPHPPPTIPTPAASVKNTQPPSAGSGHVPMSAPSTPVNCSPRVQFSPLPTPSRGRSASSSSAGSALGVQNGPPRSGRAV